MATLPNGNITKWKGRIPAKKSPEFFSPLEKFSKNSQNSEKLFQNILK